MTKRLGFTLAEVLITLGIIGVVASMTIPTLMVNINTKQWSTAANVFEKKLNESLKTMNTQQTVSGHTTTLSFVEELAKHFKINKICQNDKLQDCFSETVYWGAGEATPEEIDMTKIKQASDFGLEDWGTELIGVQFANGVSGLVAYNPNCSGDPYSNQFKGTDCISILYDVSGFKNPNTSGKDLGNYGVINKLGNSGCAFKLSGICYSAPFLPEPISKEECDSLKSSLGIQECIYGGNDYWAGAVKACGGINKMPTGTQLAEIANYVYDVTDIGVTSYKENLTMNANKAASLGFKLNSYNEFYVWSGEEISDDENPPYAYFRAFYSTSSGWFDYGRSNDNLYAVCLSDAN